MKKSLSIFLCLIIICTMIYIPSVEASIDLATFNSKLTAFKNERYGHGSIYQDNPNLTGGYQCFGYANELALYIWGSYPTKSMSATSVNSGWNVTYGGSAVDNLCIGDIVRYRYHSIFITGISGDTIYYCHANSPSGTNKVTYDNTIARSTLKSRVSEQLTSPNTTKTGWVAHYTNGLSPSTPEEPETEIVDSPTLSVQAGTTGSNTIFSWNNVEGASSYNLKIWKDSYLDGNAYIDKTNVSSGIGISLPTGIYYAYIDACNSNMTDWKMSNIVSFKVVDMASPTLEVKAGTANTNSVFTWNAVEGASSYNLKIWKDSYLEGSAYINKTDVPSGIGVSLPVGTYYAYIDACNATMTDWKMSNIVSFKVVDAIPHITSNVKKVGNNFIVNVNLINIDTSYEVIVAGYNSERLIDIKIVSNVTDSINLTGEINKIKVMVWKSLSTLKPLCEAEEITSDKFIIE